MAEGSRRYALNQQPLEISQILLEAQHRWLRPSEVCEILRNYQNFQLTPDPPHKPPGGSLFLFDRKALRYFRKDGHQWRKKKDGKTVREAHEKLKAGSVDVLHCYYAHGEDNENFQRRSYWMLDGQLEHIVLVHYREVKEGNRSGIPRLSNANSAAQTVSFQNGSAHCPVQDNRSTLTVQAAYASSPSTANWSGQTPSSEVEDVDSGDDLGTSSFAEAVSCSGPQNVSLQAHDTPGLSELPVNYLTSGLSDVRVGHEGISSMWTGFQSSGRTVSSMQEQCINFDQLNGSAIVTRKPTDAKLDTYGLIKDNLTGVDSVFPDGNFPILNRESRRTAQGLQKNGNPGYVDYLPSDKGALTDVSMFQVPHEHDLHLAQNENDPGSSTTVSANEKSLVFGNIAPLGGSCNDQSEELKKLDSFGRWMNKEIGGDCDDALMASDSGNYWNSLDAQNDDKEVSSLSLHLLDVDSLGPSLSRDQLFSICDYSPDWALSGVETKVLITGKFLENVKLPDSTKWCCMFGEVEVSAEVLSQNVLRCQVPSHAPGRVPFYITCSNRLACSEVREFEFLKNPPGVPFSIAVKNELEDEMRLQIRFAKMLYLGSQKKRLDCSVEKCEKCSVKNDIFSMGTDDEKEWGQIVRISMALEGTHGNPQEALIQKLLKDRLYEWLVCKVHEEGKGPNVFDDGGQGLIHLAAALGYEWAIGPMVAAGIKPNFRDARGRTALHWAAYFGREETVVALVRLGATPGSVEDPTPQFPGGRTAADLASSRGHKGIAGYLAEADLTSYLASLTIKENVMDGVAATPAADEAIETEEEQHVVSPDGRMEEQLSLRGILAAARKSAQAAALIQAALRARSFQLRQSQTTSDENLEASTNVVALVSLKKAPKMSHFSDYLHSAAAVRIQQKFRGWKGRKEFLKIRNRIVKIQAHVRGHQVRKIYRKVVWSVGIVEKAILRWRRKRIGLRGFRAEIAVGNVENESRKMDEYDHLRDGRKQKVAGVENALARVHSMVRNPEARDQYMRLVTKFQKFKMEDEKSSSQQPLPDNLENDIKEEDLLPLMTT